MAETRKVSGRGGWKTGHFMLAQERQLNKWERTDYERYQAWCKEVIGCNAAKEHIWFIENQSIKPRSL